MTNTIHPLQRLLAYGKNYYFQTWQAVISSIFNKLCDIAPEILIGAAVDVVVKKQDSFIATWGVRDVRQQLIALTIVTVIVWVLESVSQYVYTNLWRNLSQKIQHNLRLDAYGHIQELDLVYFENQSTGNLMAILGDDINQLERFPILLQ